MSSLKNYILSTLIYINERAAYEGQGLSLLEQPEYFGSWIINNYGRQIIYDGKEQWFVMRLKINEANFIDETIIKLKQITPEKIELLAIVNYLAEVVCLVMLFYLVKIYPTKISKHLF